MRVVDANVIDADVAEINTVDWSIRASLKEAPQVIKE